MALPQPKPGRPVVVTGASSGIGTELARGFARAGHDLVLVARRRDRLEDLAVELRADHAVTVTVRPCDLGDADDRRTLAAELAAGAIAALCNCAGFGTSGTFHTLPLDREREELEVNVVAVMELVHAVLPGMIAQGEGAILNVASIAAMQPLPGLATYAATKAFVHSFSEAVAEELRGTGVSCTSLCPGPVPTEWAEIADAQALSVKPAQVLPADVAAAAIRGMRSGRRVVVPGRVPTLIATVGRHTPRNVLLPVLNVVTRRGA